MLDIYSPGQAEILFQFWSPKIEWFVIGGPADGNEAQTIISRFPDVKCVGFEPNATFRHKQISEMQFPGEVHNIALYNDDKEVVLCVPLEDPRSSSLNIRHIRHTGAINTNSVPARRLDHLSNIFGPFNNCCLWLDIEDSESKALQGATKLLESGNVLLANIEMYNKPDDYLVDFMRQYGLEVVETWNTGAMVNLRDVIFRKRGLDD